MTSLFSRSGSQQSVHPIGERPGTKRDVEIILRAQGFSPVYPIRTYAYPNTKNGRLESHAPHGPDRLLAGGRHIQPEDRYVRAGEIFGPLCVKAVEDLNVKAFGFQRGLDDFSDGANFVNHNR